MNSSWIASQIATINWFKEYISTETSLAWLEVLKKSSQIHLLSPGCQYIHLDDNLSIMLLFINARYLRPGKTCHWIHRSRPEDIQPLVNTLKYDTRFAKVLFFQLFWKRRLDIYKYMNLFNATYVYVYLKRSHNVA